jgi:hypothetical protein
MVRQPTIDSMRIGSVNGLWLSFSLLYECHASQIPARNAEIRVHIPGFEKIPNTQSRQRVHVHSNPHLHSDPPILYAGKATRMIGNTGLVFFSTRFPGSQISICSNLYIHLSKWHCCRISVHQVPHGCRLLDFLRTHLHSRNYLQARISIQKQSCRRP